MITISPERKEVYRRILEINGEEKQIFKLFEEMAEVQKEICKYVEGKAPGDQQIRIAEEIADTEIMLEQMKCLFGLEEAVEKQKVYKILRLIRFIQKEECKNERR